MGRREGGREGWREGWRKGRWKEIQGREVEREGGKNSILNGQHHRSWHVTTRALRQEQPDALNNNLSLSAIRHIRGIVTYKRNCHVNNDLSLSAIRRAHATVHAKPYRRMIRCHPKASHMPSKSITYAIQEHHATPSKTIMQGNPKASCNSPQKHQRTHARTHRGPTPAGQAQRRQRETTSHE